MTTQSLYPTLAAGILLFTADAMAQVPSPPSDTLRLSLEKCIEIALDENPTVKVADMEITRLDYSKKETLGQLLPTVSFGGTYSRTLEKQTMYMDGFGGSGGSSSTPGEGSTDTEEPATRASARPASGIKVGRDNSYSLGFSASMPLIAPQLWKTLDLSESRIMESVEKSRQSRLQLINQVKNAYYTLLLAEDTHRTVLESYDMAKLTADTYQKRYSLGAASDYDVLRTQVALQNVEPELTQAVIAIRQARLQLAILLGFDTGIAISPTQKLSDYEETMYERALQLSTDIKDNSDMRLLDIQTRQLNDALKIQKMSWFPTLALSANYNWTAMNNGSPFKNLRWTPYSMIGLTLSVPLFEGGQRYSRIKQARIQVEEMKWQRDNLQRTITMQAEVALDNINLNVKQIASCARSIEQAERAHTIQKESFDIGATTYLDLRDSELALTRSRLAYYQSVYNYLTGCSDLELLLGKDIPPTAKPL